MKENELLKHQMDSEAYQNSITQLKLRVDALNSKIEGMQNEKQKLNEQLDATKDMLMINLKIKKQEDRDEKEARMREMRSIQGIIGHAKAWSTIFKFLTVKEYMQIGKLSKKMYTIMIDNPAGRTCLHYVKIKYVNQQPLYTVNFNNNKP